jgi:hypothetical protein
LRRVGGRLRARPAVRARRGEAAWPESWRDALRIMRDRRGRLVMHPDDARAAMAAGVDPALVCVSPYASRGVAFAVADSMGLWRIYDPDRVPGAIRDRR